MRRVALAAGIVVLLAAWLSPLAGVAESPFVQHMIVHLAVVAVAAPLISVWLSGLRWTTDAIIPPMPASAIEFAVVWLWHVPMLHGLARLSPVAWGLEQLSFLLAGLLLWTSALGRSESGEGGTGAGVLALLMTSMHMVLLGTLLTLAPRPLYIHGIQTLGDVYAHLAGQRLGGLLMLAGGGIPYLAGGLYLVNRLLHEPGVAVRVTPGDAGRT